MYRDRYIDRYGRPSGRGLFEDPYDAERKIRELEAQQRREEFKRSEDIRIRAEIEASKKLEESKIKRKLLLL